MTIGRHTRTAKAAVTALLLTAAPSIALAEASGPYYERSFVLAADERCGLFHQDVGAALAAATRQAYSVALRAGTAEAELRTVAARARARAATVSCTDSELVTVKQRVEQAFSGWVRMPSMTFPGVRADWTANRIVSTRPSWRLMQGSRTGASPVTIGYTAGEISDRLTAVVSFHGRPRPYAARIVMRDPARSPRAWLGGASDLPPESVRRSYWAVTYGAAEAELLTEGKRSGEAWRFPAEVATAIEQLDPRESFAVEFHFRDNSVASVTFEAGDFAAGRAFMAMGPLGGRQS